MTGLKQYPAHHSSKKEKYLPWGCNKTESGTGGPVLPQQTLQETFQT